MEINAVEIGYRIRSLRESKKYSRDKFCELVGISSKFLYEIENGKKGFSACVLCNIAEVCGVSYEYIMLGSEYKSSDYPEILESIKDEDLNGIITILRCISNIKASR